jgi:hypothetical protein
MAGGVAAKVEHLPSKHEALSSKSQYQPKKKKSAKRVSGMQ